MKTKNLLFLAVSATLVGFSSCKKTSSAVDEYETTFELSADQGIADNLTEDANDVLNEAAVDKNLMGGRGTETAQTTNTLSCAAITVTPATGFPKTMIIDFGTGCTSTNGVARTGKITVVLSDSLRKSGSTATMTFDNYFVNGFKKEGIITWTNTSTVQIKSWQRKVENGKITAPGGNYWLHYGVRDIVQTAGASTPLNLLDDVYSITGNHTVTNAAGKTRTAVILTALEKKATCTNIDMGTVKVQGPNHFATIDFGNGTCDNIATISIDGRPSRTFLLR
ncbi:MAG: hypothetical protein ABJA78_14685 [Ferruginibacter sp.]